MKNFSVLFFYLIFVQLFSFGQKKIDYDNNTKWFWGANGGVTWHSTDVRTKNNWGYGFILGKSFNYDYGKALSFDFRSRALHGEWYGQNLTKSDTNVLNNKLSTGNTNYKDSLNYYLLNFKSIMYSLDLELVIHANSLRERTGFDLYAFGGFGLSTFKTKGDLLGKNGSFYNYNELSKIDDGALSNFQDKKFESILDGSTKSMKYYLTSSVGAGLGYQISRNITLGLEHKLIFTRVDNFDGHNDGKGSNNTFITRANDIAHYSNAYIRFYIHHNRVKEEDTKTDNVNTPTPDNQQIPEITFTNPVASGTSVNSNVFTIKANVNFIQSRDNLNFKHNGVYTEGFSYNNTSKKFESNVILVPGQNIFEIVASNAYGFDQKSTIIIFKEAQQAPPTVNFQNPTTNPFNTSNNSMQVRATVLNVKDQSQISVSVNGIQINNYNFSTTNGNLNFNTNLTVGTNVITISANNQVGSDFKTTTVIYNPVILEQQPIVYFTDPIHSPFVTTNASFTINAEIFNVSGSQNISFKQNGNFNQNFVYNTFNNEFESFVYLVPGQNVFEIIASNSSGTAQATTIVTYQKTAPQPPVVTITNPIISPFTSNSFICPLNATILNVANANQIQVNVNGQVVNFDYNSFSKTLSTNVNLNEGQNIVTVTANNNEGTDSKQVSIIYVKPNVVQAPIVSYNNPSINPTQVETANMKIDALALNMDNKNGINISLNGKTITEFNFNNNSKTISFPITLIEGANILSITATNSAGTDSKSTTIIFNKAPRILPPTVNIIAPHDNPTTVYNSNYLVKALVGGVAGKNNIIVKVNGISTTNFTYNPSNEMVRINANLLGGANIFEISANNSAGTDSKTTTIIYQASEPLKIPIVKIEVPLKKNIETASASTQIEATVLNVLSRNNIDVKVNGQNFTNFNYDDETKKLSFLMPLNEGLNKLVISATNAAGSHQDNSNITYKKEVKIDAPVVSFTQPGVAGEVVFAQNYTIKASVLNVENANQITLSQNGQLVNPQNYVYNSNTKELRYVCVLNLGNNIFTITASNVSGTASSTTNVQFKKEDKPCEKPKISLITQLVSGAEVTQNNLEFKFKTSNIVTQNQLEIFLNGVVIQGVFNLTSKTMVLNLNLKEGQNIVEIKAKNKCGEDNFNSIIVYKKPNTPCTNIPVIQLLEPNKIETSTENESFDIRVSIINIVNKTDIQFKMNGQNTNFDFDANVKTLTSKVNLKNGLNTFEIQTSNDCGSATLTFRITKKECKKPSITINNTSVANNASTSNETFTLEGTVMEVSNQANIEVTNSGKPINFVFNKLLNTISINTNLVEGFNSITIKAKNNCGEDVKTHNITRIKVEKIEPPTIKIVNPATTPFQTSSPAFNVQAVTQNVSSKNQTSLTINGQPVNASFNPLNGSMTYNLTLVEGNNVIVATASNKGGTASDSKTIVYSKPNLVQKPQIILLNPAACPATLNKGSNQISGIVKNISAVNQVQIKVNGNPVSNFNPILSEDKLNFQFNVNLVQANVFTQIEIVATNTAGNDTKSCQVKFEESTNNCIPIVSANFSADDKSVTVTSSKELSNVVLKFHDGTVQKFDNLSGMSKTFSGTTLFANKCIVGVWIKSGCNQSSDGPGYGEFVANPKKKTTCQSSQDGNGSCKPVIKAEFSADSKTVTVFSTKALSNVVLKYFDGTVQKFDNLSGLTKVLTGNGANLGKCIVGVWIKSGCNQSNDGPGYGEYVANNNVSSNCGSSSNPTNCKPTINVVFNANSKKATVTSDKEINIIIMKFHDGQEQRLNVNSVLNRVVSGTGVNQGKCIVGVWVKSGCNQNALGAQYGDWFANPQNVSNCAAGNGNNGHGNNEDGIDSSNPGQGGGGPNGGTDGSGDDESGKGGGKNKPKNPAPKPPTNSGGKRGG